VGAEEPQRLFAHDAEAVRHVRGERDGVALLQPDFLVLPAVHPGLGHAVEDVQDFM
jgi:hypothetical protein